MQLVLATVTERSPDGCTVRVLDGPGPRRAGFSAPFRPRSDSLGPGCLVAIDVAADPPLVVWRWFPARVLAVGPDHLRLDEPFHGEIEAPVTTPPPTVDEIVYVTTGLAEGWRVDATADRPGAAAPALADIEELYARMFYSDGA